MQSGRFDRVCESSAEVGILLILALAVIASKSISSAESVVPLALLCFLLLDALRPSVRWLIWATVTLFAGGMVGFSVRFVVEFPLTAHPELIRRMFIGSFSHPLPSAWIVVVLVIAFYALHRRFISPGRSLHSRLVGAAVLFAAIALYHLSLGSRFSLSLSNATLSIPYAPILLFLAVGSQCVRFIGGRQIRFGDIQLGFAHCAALGLLALHLVALPLLLSSRYGVDATHQLSILGAILGPLLFACLVNTRLASSRPGQRVKFSVTLGLAAVVIWVWVRVDMLPELVAGIVADGI